MTPRRSGRVWLAAVCVASTAVVVAAGCVPPAPPGSGPEGAELLVSLVFTGAVEHTVEGPVTAGGLTFPRSSGRLVGVRGQVEVPGRGASPARVAVDLRIDGALASGGIDVVDPAAGVRVSTPLVGGQVEVVDGAVSGSASWARIWRVVELAPYRLEWSVTEGTGPVPEHPGPPAADAGSLRGVTYNVAGLPEPLSGASPIAAAPYLGPLLDPFDLVLLQEDFLYTDLVARGLSQPWSSEPEVLPWGSDPTRPSAIVGSGLSRYSNLPMSGHVRVRWPGCFGGLPFDGGAGDCLSQKGFSVARHELAPGVSVDVYNLHAEAGSTPQDDHWSARQYEALAVHISTHSAGRAVLLGGDTNLHVDRPADLAIWSTFLSATGLVDACDLVDCSDDPTTIDRWALRSGEDVELEPTSWSVPAATFAFPGGGPLSDHDPTVLTVDWRTG